jgi:hypothetical protein
MVLTTAGENLLSQLHKMGGWGKNFIFMPLDSWLSSHLAIPNFYDDEASSDFGWRLVASSRSPNPGKSTIHLDHLQLLDLIKSTYTAVKLANFNEADALSIFEMLATMEAAEGRVLPQVEFEKALSTLVTEFPSDIFRLSKRRGRGLYVALKSPV